MIKDCQCPECGAVVKIDLPSRLPRIKCRACGSHVRPADFKEVVTRTVYCPECGTPHSLAPDNQPGWLKCTNPKCGKTNRTSKFTDTPPEQEDEGTSTRLGECIPAPDDVGKTYRPGVLRWQSDDGGWTGVERDFELTRGRNTLGRESSSSRSSIQFPTADSFMSKNHAVVEVEMMRDSTFEHSLSDAGSVNGTFLNGNRLDEGDEIVLTSGDTIRMGRTTFVFLTR